MKISRTLWLALLLSLLIHALSVVGMFATSWQHFFQSDTIESLPSQFDAHLVAAAAKPVGNVAKAVRKPKTVRAKSAANFTPPENSIAVASAPEATMAEEPINTGILADSPAAETTSKPETVTPLATHDEANLPGFPSRIEINYRLSTSIADGTANYVWSREGDAYKIESTMRATGIFADLLLGTITQISHGAISSKGLAPTSFSMQRGEAAAETAEFNMPEGKITLTRRDNQQTLPLENNLQDLQSFLFQLAYEIPLVKIETDRINVTLTNARKIYTYRFKHIGEETLVLPAGKFQTIHLLSEASNPEDAYEVWLAIEQHYVPVKLKFYVGRFPAEQIADKLVTQP